MAGSQHYSLRWNNHQSHVLSAFDDLLQNEALVDCTLVCEDTSIKAHKVVLSACSPYFQKIFIDNPCKHPIIVLKDVRGWEVQCIVDFMYKGETSVPEAQLAGLIKAAEGLKVRGLTSSDHSRGLSLEPTSEPFPPGRRQQAPPLPARYAHRSPSPSRYHHGDHSPPHNKLAGISSSTNGQPMSSSSQSSPMSLATLQHELQQPRRKQARPRRRSGDSVGASSMDASKLDSPPRKSPQHGEEKEGQPENLSMKRPSCSPAINLVKMESLMEADAAARERNASHRPSSTSADSSTMLHHHPHHPLLLRAASANGLVDGDKHHLQQHHQHHAHHGHPHHGAESSISPSQRASSAHAASSSSPSSSVPSPFQRFTPGAMGVSHIAEHEARVEALQVITRGFK
jgi:hypothetical protein